MKIIQNVLQKTRASKLWFSMMVVFMVIINVSLADAQSLKKGEEFKANDGRPGTIRVVSSNEVEVELKRDEILLGKYSIDDERLRVVIGVFGASLVQYYKITPDGLVEEKGGRVFYSKAGLTAAKFTSNGGEVTDKRTGLIWRRCAEGMAYRGGTCTGTASTFTHEQALQHAAAQARRTGKAWRVPEKDELASIVVEGHNPTIDPTDFPATPTDRFFWSASPNVGVSFLVYCVDFENGCVGSVRDNSNYVRLVRAGQ